MSELWSIAPWLVAMGGLVCVSAFFSASEAALFSLTHAQRKLLSSGRPADRIVGDLLSRPERLLSAVLFWNLVANISYFALSSVCALQLERSESLGPTIPLIFAISSVLAIIVFSEMLPKSIAVTQPRLVARAVSLPLAAAIRAVDSIMPALQTVMRVSQRLIWPEFKAEPFLEIADLQRAIELSVTDAKLARQEKAILQNIVLLSDIRVDEWMRPRTQFRAFRPPVDLADIGGKVPPDGYLLITEKDSEEIQYALRLGDYLRLPDRMLETLADPVTYVPWSATVADALQRLARDGNRVAAIVNEYGDTIGILSVDDILETVFSYVPSRIRRLLDRNPVHQLSSNRWLVAGMISLRRLARQINVTLPDTHVVTLAGVIQQQMQRLAAAGDVCQWGPLHLRVVEAPQRGILLVEVSLLSDQPENA